VLIKNIYFVLRRYFVVLIIHSFEGGDKMEYDLDIKDSRLYEYLEAGQEYESDDDEPEDDYIPAWEMEW
jgi:hypothetical protein